MNDLSTRTLQPNLASPDAARRAALACMAALAVALGIGRFAFTPLLPLMLHGGELDIRLGGWLASLNYAGYFLGAIACVAVRVEAARVVKAGLASTVLLVLAMGLTHQFWIWAVVRFIAGAISAWTFVFASQWGLRRLAELGANEWGGVIYTGPGLGIAATGLLVSAAGGYGASAGWIGFGLVSAVLTVLVWRTFEPATTAKGSATASPRKNAAVQTDAHRQRVHLHRADAFWLIVLYGVPGFGYIITATFLPVIARAALPVDSPWPDLFWPMFGGALVVGALVGARLPAHWDNRTLLAGCYVLQALGILAGIVSPTAGGFALGSALIGLPFTAITLFAMREARRLHGDNAAGLMGYATAAYGLGQIVGPLVAAPIAAHTGSFALALWLAALTLLAGAVGLVVVTALRPSLRA
ncbi:YbfB/YjiJ family MFS transporter [Paraburkholderia caribensis]|uniref:YbfB/YjiJ family MFS transporter n=1 Tax=Paraburkholderia caribensis TaxID=75105 RepID=UPI00078BDEB7|nr:YbfB/YjiJ family MFS transporter [Paraburkholderia caribensis]AMV42077.1 MFS transporter [Paraburkholderia caribensis]